MEERITRASQDFGALRKPVFLDKNLRLSTKATIYQACVISILLYGSECWIPLRKHLRKLDSFHHRCVRLILGISNQQQWMQRISAPQILRRWGDTESVSMKVTRRRLQWLGHLARMPDHRLPKTALFAWLPQPRPRCGPRRRWRDVIRSDLKLLGVPEGEWYREACSRDEWRVRCRSELVSEDPSTDIRSASLPSRVSCDVCHRTFRRESDKNRHKCIEERQKPVSEQRGSTQCTTCDRWFRSRGGLAVHHCRPGT